MNSIAKLDALAKDAGTISAICEAYAKLSLTSRKYLLDALVEYQGVPAKVKTKAVPAAPVSKVARRPSRRQVVKSDVLAAMTNVGGIHVRDLARKVYGSGSMRHTSATTCHLVVLKKSGQVRQVERGVWELAPQLAVAS